MATPLTYVIDTLAFEVYVNRSSLSDQNVPTKIRPWLIVYMEPISKRVLASYLSEHHPDRESIKAILYKAFFANGQDKRSALLPDNIWFNAGISTLFSSLQHPTQALHITPRSVPLFAKGIAKGILERFFLQVQHAYILACSPGEDSSGKHFIARRVVKDGIHSRKNRYWHSDLARYMGKEVYIRMESTQISPETIEVFFEQQWICSASLLEATNENDVQEAE